MEPGLPGDRDRHVDFVVGRIRPERRIGNVDDLEAVAIVDDGWGEHIGPRRPVRKLCDQRHDGRTSFARIEHNPRFVIEAARPAVTGEVRVVVRERRAVRGRPKAVLRQHGFAARGADREHDRAVGGPRRFCQAGSHCRQGETGSRGREHPDGGESMSDEL